jgi:hypothetical protein
MQTETSHSSSPGEALLPQEQQMLLLLETMSQLEQVTQKRHQELLQQLQSGSTQTLLSALEQQLLAVSQQTQASWTELQRQLLPLLQTEPSSLWEKRWSEQQKEHHDLLQLLRQMQDEASASSSRRSSVEPEQLSALLSHQQQLQDQLGPLLPVLQELPKFLFALGRLDMALSTTAAERLMQPAAPSSSVRPQDLEALVVELRQLWRKQEKSVLRLKSSLQTDSQALGQELGAKLSRDLEEVLEKRLKPLPLLTGGAVRQAVGELKSLRAPRPETELPQGPSPLGIVLLSSFTSTALTALWWSGLPGWLWILLVGWWRG